MVHSTQTLAFPGQLFVLVFEDNQLELVDAGTIFFDEMVAGQVAKNFQSQYPPEGEKGYRQIVVRPMVYDRRKNLLEISVVTSLKAIVSAVADGCTVTNFGPTSHVFFFIKDLSTGPWWERLRIHHAYREENEGEITKIIESGIAEGWGHLETEVLPEQKDRERQLRLVNQSLARLRQHPIPEPSNYEEWMNVWYYMKRELRSRAIDLVTNQVCGKQY